jgi:hypothetical protein
MTRKLFVPAIVFLTALSGSASAAELVKVRLYVEGAF